jgi:hypothetical protein
MLLMCSKKEIALGDNHKTSWQEKFVLCLSFNLLGGGTYDLEPMVKEGLPFILPFGVRQEKLSTALAFDKFVNNVKSPCHNGTSFRILL